ncbi:hypothetical protein ASG65_12125 [Bacillus sp. Leaf13]|nr:hypothetical protein ASG65_12125 [Bacillus sp. Leaf13]
MAKQLISFLNIFLSISAIAFVVVFIYTNLANIELNDKIGTGIFYLKGYYEEGNEIVTEQGVGVITIPFVVGFLLSLLVKVLQFSLKRKTY